MRQIRMVEHSREKQDKGVQDNDLTVTSIKELFVNEIMDLNKQLNRQIDAFKVQLHLKDEASGREVLHRNVRDGRFLKDVVREISGLRSGYVSELTL